MAGSQWKEDLNKLKAGSPEQVAASPEKWRQELETLKASSPELHEKLGSVTTDLNTAEAELKVLKNNDLSQKPDGEEAGP